MLAAGLVDDLLHRFGYTAVAAVILLESLGIPVPGETILIAAAVYAGVTGRLSPLAIVVVAATAAAVGNLLGYAIGHWGGYRLLIRYGHRLRMNEGRIKLARYLFAEHGVWIILAGRFVAVLRTYAALLAGTARMPVLRFSLCTLVSSAAWAALYGSGGYYLGSRITAIGSSVGWALLAVAVVLIAAIGYAIHRSEHRLIRRAEARYPGPIDAP